MVYTVFNSLKSYPHVQSEMTLQNKCGRL